MEKVRKDIIRFALDYNILNIHTYSGYRGDLLVKFTVNDKDLDTTLAIKREAERLGMEVVVKDNKELLVFEIYTIIADHDVYNLKLDVE